MNRSCLDEVGDSIPGGSNCQSKTMKVLRGQDALNIVQYSIRKLVQRLGKNSRLETQMQKKLHE